MSISTTGKGIIIEHFLVLIYANIYFSKCFYGMVGCRGSLICLLPPWPEQLFSTWILCFFPWINRQPEEPSFCTWPEPPPASWVPCLDCLSGPACSYSWSLPHCFHLLPTDVTYRADGLSKSRFFHHPWEEGHTLFSDPMWLRQFPKTLYACLPPLLLTRTVFDLFPSIAIPYTWTAFKYLTISPVTSSASAFHHLHPLSKYEWHQALFKRFSLSRHREVTWW